MGDEQAAREHAEPTVTQDVPSPQAASGRGIGELQVLLASGRPSPQQVAEVVSRHPTEQGAMFAMLHGKLGNAFVHAVLDATGKDLTALAGGQTTAQPTVRTTTDPAVDALLLRHPTTARGPTGTAAWLLEAETAGFVETNQAKPQLEQLRDDAPLIHSNSPHYDKEKKDRDMHPGRFDHVITNPKGGFELKLQDANVLATIVAVVTKRMDAWRSAGGTKPVLALGDFLRGDVGFSPEKVNSPHKDGHAIDMFLRKSGTNDAIELLRDLPEGKLRIFFDNPGALHINTEPGGYALGIPAGNGYTSSELAMDKTDPWRNRAMDRLEREAGDDHAKTLHTKCVNTHTGDWFDSTATWDGSGWKWSKWAPIQVDAESQIISAPLKKAIADYRNRSKTP